MVAYSIPLKLILIAVMTLTLLQAFVEAVECGNFNGTPPRQADYFTKSFQTPKDGRSIRDFTRNDEGFRVTSNYFYGLQDQPLYIAVYPGNKDRIIQIITNISRQSPGPNYALIHVKAGQACDVNNMKGGDVTDVVLFS